MRLSVVKKADKSSSIHKDLYVLIHKSRNGWSIIGTTRRGVDLKDCEFHASQHFNTQDYVNGDEILIHNFVDLSPSIHEFEGMDEMQSGDIVMIRKDSSDGKALRPDLIDGTWRIVRNYSHTHNEKEDIFHVQSQIEREITIKVSRSSLYHPVTPSRLSVVK